MPCPPSSPASLGEQSLRRPPLIDSFHRQQRLCTFAGKGRMVLADEPEADEASAVEIDSAGGTYEKAPDGALRWPAPDRDSPQLGSFNGAYAPADAIGTLLRMEG